LKTSAPIIASFVVGALVVLVLLRGQNSDAAESVPPSPVRATIARAFSGAATVDVPARVATPADVHSAARIAIPRLRLKAVVGTSLNKGPAWWPVTGRPSGGDTVAIAGHRTTHTHPFLDLDRLVPGDAIYVRWQGVSHRYVVSGRRIVSSKQRHIGDARGHEVLILSTCTPKGSARQRLLVYARPDTHP
jgi:sortase A